ncbi:universal stress protein [Halorussus amylolyticus]|uniref:universal stress protein n=1 Tax=Halorussus amylolyticus TaxID=1126242 RepID=UPI0010509BC0|nr:universal stress protein [Halorussus amylolyticus]
MASSVLVPMDDSEMAVHALEYALETHPDADITVLHVVGGPSPMMGKAASITLDEDVEDAAEKRSSEIFERARDLAESYGVEISTDVALGSPAKLIISRAEDFEAVVIGSHSGSLAERLFVGNVAEKVFRDSPVPVTVVR